MPVGDDAQNDDGGEEEEALDEDSAEESGSDDSGDSGDDDESEEEKTPPPPIELPDRATRGKRLRAVCIQPPFWAFRFARGSKHGHLRTRRSPISHKCSILYTSSGWSHVLQSPVRYASWPRAAQSVRGLPADLCIAIAAWP